MALCVHAARIEDLQSTPRRDSAEIEHLRAVVRTDAARIEQLSAALRRNAAQQRKPSADLAQPRLKGPATRGYLRHPFLTPQDRARDKTFHPFLTDKRKAEVRIIPLGGKRAAVAAGSARLTQVGRDGEPSPGR